MKFLHRSGHAFAEHAIGMTAFLALFPGFFFYHTALGLGSMGAFLGGYFAPVSVLFAGPLCFIYAYQVRHDRNQLTRSDLFFNLYIAYFLCVVAVNAIAGANPHIVANHILGVLFTVNLFFIFKFTDFGRRSFRIAAFASMVAMSAIVFAFSVDGSFYLAPLGAAKNPESLATYQGFSRSYLLTFAVVIAYTRPMGLRVLLYCMAAPTLFVNTARSEFVAMLVMVPIVELYHARRKMLITFVFVALIFFIYVNLDTLLSLLPSSRILELLDLSHSTSANKRQQLSEYALHTIARYPVFGDYASYPPGLYSHNVLSAWVDTGLFGFLFVLALVIVPAIPMGIKGYFTANKHGEFLIGFSLGCITLLLLITSHYFTDMFIGATLGAYAKYRYGRTHAYRRPPELRPSAPRHPYSHQGVPAPGAARL